jgi:hypothetical protein
MAYGKIPQRTAEGDRLRAAARLLAMAGGPGDGSTQEAVQLAVGLVRLARAVGELRQAEQHAAQAAARRAAEASMRPLPGEDERSDGWQVTAATAVPECPEATRHRQRRLPGSAATRPASTGGRQQPHRIPAPAEPGTVRSPPSRAGPGRAGPRQAGRGGRRAAPGAASRRASGSSEEGGRRPARRSQPIEGGRRCAGHPHPGAAGPDHPQARRRSTA